MKSLNLVFSEMWVKSILIKQINEVKKIIKIKKFTIAIISINCSLKYDIKTRTRDKKYAGEEYKNADIIFLKSKFFISFKHNFKT